MTQKFSAPARPPSDTSSDILTRDMNSSGAEQYFGDIRVYCAWSDAEQNALHAHQKRQERGEQKTPDDFTSTDDTSFIITLEDVLLTAWGTAMGDGG